LPWLDKELIEYVGKDKIKKSQKCCGEKGNDNHQQCEDDCLLTGWPRHMFEFSTGVFEILGESAHVV
jgi:hypothetical protein